MTLQRVLLLCSIALLAACASKYSQPPINLPYASLIITGNHSGATTSNLYVVCTEEKCEPNKGSVQLAAFNWANPNEQTVRVAAKDRIRFKAFAANTVAGSSTFINGTIVMSGTQCVNAFSFIPEAGRTYKLQQNLDSRGCQIRLVDVNSGQTPESFSN